MDSVTWLVAIVALLVLGGLIWWFVRSRKTTASLASSSVMTPSPGRITTQSNLSGAEAGVLLMALQDPANSNVYLAVGPDAAVERLGGERMVFLSKAGSGAAGVNTLLQGANSYQQATAIVTFSRETTALLDSGMTLMQGVNGLQYGSIIDPSTGRIVAQAQLVTSTGTAVAAMASMGTAVTLAAIQMQLAAISRQLKDVTRKVAGIAENQRLDQISDLVSTVRTIDQTRERILAGGQATDRLMTPINGQGRDLDKHIERLTRQTHKRIERMRAARGQTARLDWLKHEGQDAVEDICSLVMATRGWAMYQALHAANLLAPGNDADRDPQDRAASMMVTQVRERLTDVYTVTVELAYELDRVLQLATLAPGRVTLKEKAAGQVIHRKMTRDQTKQLASSLRDLLATAGLPVPDVPGLPADATIIGHPQAPYEWEEHVGALLGRDERVQAVVHGLGAGGSHTLNSSPSVVLITDRRVIGLRQQRFLETGMLEYSCAFDEIQYSEVSTAYRLTVLRFRLKSGLRILRAGDAVDINVSHDEAWAAKNLFDDVRQGHLANETAQGPVIEVDGMQVLRARPAESPVTIQAVPAHRA